MSLKQTIKSRKTAGDTIVEVLIAIAALALILGAAYATTRKSQQANQASRERSQAAEVVEGQIERLKVLLAAKEDVPDLEAFCVNDIASDFEEMTGLNPLADPLTSYTNYCANVENLFNVAIQQTALNSNTYRVTARWDRVGGGDEQLVIFYRVYGDV